MNLSRASEMFQYADILLVFFFITCHARGLNGGYMYKEACKSLGPVKYDDSCELCSSPLKYVGQHDSCNQGLVCVHGDKDVRNGNVLAFDDCRYYSCQDAFSDWGKYVSKPWNFCRRYQLYSVPTIPWTNVTANVGSHFLKVISIHVRGGTNLTLNITVDMLPHGLQEQMNGFPDTYFLRIQSLHNLPTVDQYFRTWPLQRIYKFKLNPAAVKRKDTKAWITFPCMSGLEPCNSSGYNIYHMVLALFNTNTQSQFIREYTITAHIGSDTKSWTPAIAVSVVNQTVYAVFGPINPSSTLQSDKYLVSLYSIPSNNIFEEITIPTFADSFATTFLDVPYGSYRVEVSVVTLTTSYKFMSHSFTIQHLNEEQGSNLETLIYLSIGLPALVIVSFAVITCICKDKLFSIFNHPKEERKTIFLLHSRKTEAERTLALHFKDFISCPEISVLNLSDDIKSDLLEWLEKNIPQCDMIICLWSPSANDDIQRTQTDVVVQDKFHSVLHYVKQYSFSCHLCKVVVYIPDYPLKSSIFDASWCQINLLKKGHCLPQKCFKVTPRDIKKKFREKVIKNTLLYKHWKQCTINQKKFCGQNKECHKSDMASSVNNKESDEGTFDMVINDDCDCLNTERPTIENTSGSPIYSGGLEQNISRGGTVDSCCTHVYEEEKPLIGSGQNPQQIQSDEPPDSNPIQELRKFALGPL